MEKEFVPYEIALELKQLGFDEPCFATYNDKGELRGADLLEFNKLVKQPFWSQNEASAPTFSQAFRWFREKKLSDSCICRYQKKDDGGICYYYCIDNDFGVEETRYFQEGLYSYEEAELACLQKLIEIVKTK